MGPVPDVIQTAPLVILFHLLSLFNGYIPAPPAKFLSAPGLFFLALAKSPPPPYLKYSPLFNTVPFPYDSFCSRTPFVSARVFFCSSVLLTFFFPVLNLFPVILEFSGIDPFSHRLAFPHLLFTNKLRALSRRLVLYQICVAISRGFTSSLHSSFPLPGFAFFFFHTKSTRFSVHSPVNVAFFFSHRRIGFSPNPLQWL